MMNKLPRIIAISISTREIPRGPTRGDMEIAEFSIDLGQLQLRDCQLMRRPDGTCFTAAPIVSRRHTRQNCSFVIQDANLRDGIVKAAEAAYRALGGRALDEVA